MKAMDLLYQLLRDDYCFPIRHLIHFEMGNNTFLLLGNQLFDPKLLKDQGCERVFMAEDYGLCTYEKHHKLKIYLLSLIHI